MAFTASASEGDGSGGGGGIFGNVGNLVAQALAQAEGQAQKSTSEEAPGNTRNMKKGGKVSASSRADGIAQRGKTRGRLV